MAPGVQGRGNYPAPFCQHSLGEERRLGLLPLGQSASSNKSYARVMGRVGCGVWGGAGW